MSNLNFRMGSSTRNRTMASVAALALVASGALGDRILSPMTTASAAAVMTSDSQAQAPPSFAPLIERVTPAVVSVKVSIQNVAATQDFSGQMENMPPEIQQFFKRFQQQDGMSPRAIVPKPTFGAGSGFFVSGDGYVVTNDHVIDGAKTVTVTTSDGKTLDAKVVGKDPKTDIALLKVKEAGDYPFLSFAKDPPKVGDWVVAIGNPFGLGGTATAGIVSAEERDIGAGPYERFLQIDAPINKGNSGGPTFNLKGEVVGVNTQIMSPNGGSVGVAFDVPADTVASVVDQLERDGHVSRGFLGVTIQTVSQDIADGLGLKAPEGALVDKIDPGTPAAEAGLKSGDVIARLDGQDVKDAGDLTRRIGALKPGAHVTLTYLRNGSERTADLTLAAQPNQTLAMAKPSPRGGGAAALGLQLAPANEVSGAGDQGVAIVAVDPNGDAAQKGLTDGDVILQVAGKNVSNPDDVKADIASARQEGKKAVLMKIKTAKGEIFVAFALRNA